MINPLLKLTNVNKYLSDFFSLKGISLELNRGEVHVLMGENGSGKSCLMNIIWGAYIKDSGDIFIDGSHIGKKHTKEFYQKVQMVFQDPYASLHPRQTVMQCLFEAIINFGLDNGQERVAQIMQVVHLPSKLLYSYPNQLSGGQRQRVAIARTLIVRPKLLLLDEPTSALDLSIQAEILNLLNDLKAAFNLTYLLVSHDKNIIDYMCDRVAVCASGVIN